MKKFIAVIVACLTCSGIYAQRAYEGANLGDNWSIGIHAGVTTPLTHSAFFPNMRATWGLGIGKQLTPFFGMGVEAMTSINTTASKTAFDQCKFIDLRQSEQPICRILGNTPIIRNRNRSRTRLATLCPKR